MNVDDVYRIMRFIARKNQLESLSPTEFQDSFNTAQRNYYDFLVGRIEQYRYDKPIPRVGLSMTDNIVERLAPFQMYAGIDLDGGEVPQPIDFNKLVSMSTPNNYRVYRVEQNRLQERLKDSIDPINEENAFYTEWNDYWTVYPNTIPNVYVTYLRVPRTIAWSYTLDGSGRPVYSADGVQLLTTGTGSNWSGISFTTGYTHTVGSSATLESTVYSMPNRKYALSVSTTGMSAGSYSIYFGNYTENISNNGGIERVFINTNEINSFRIIPTSDFNGTISVTLRAPSMNPEWKDNDVDEIIGRALKILGVSIKESALINYGQQVITQGE